MKRVKRQTTSAKWPFWLLLAAWLCANCPQVALFTVLTWMSESRTFAHQQRLTIEVASLLTGEKVDGIVAKAREAANDAPKPTLPAAASVKKAEMAMEETSEVLPLVLRGGFGCREDVTMPEFARSAPPHEPPRAGRFA